MFRQLLALTMVSMAAFASVCGMAQTLQVNEEILRDPTQPPWAVATEIPSAGGQLTPRFSANNFRLSFIRTGGSSPVAVINNRTLAVGDEIGGAYIVEIRAGEVVLQVGEELHVLGSFNRPVRTAVD